MANMKFVIALHYMDDEVVEMDIDPDDMYAFSKAIGNGEIYFNEERGVGMWVPIEKIRFFQLEKVDENGNRIKVKKGVD